MVRSGVEVRVGAVQDPVFGPLIALGPGGTLAELIGDAAFRLTPLTDYDAQELVRTGKAGKLLAGFRGAAPADGEAVEDLLLRVAQLAEDLPEVAELDLNPVFAGPSGCVIVDARVRIRLPQPRETLKTW
jgi:acyl-CoA synthetase (NDP forming)